jgi:rubredoxin
MEPLPAHYKSTDAWECPKCGFLIPDIQYRFLKYNIECPQCGTLIDKFNLFKFQKENQ